MSARHLWMASAVEEPKEIQFGLEGLGLDRGLGPRPGHLPGSLRSLSGGLGSRRRPLAGPQSIFFFQMGLLLLGAKECLLMSTRVDERLC